MQIVSASRCSGEPSCVVTRCRVAMPTARATTVATSCRTAAGCCRGSTRAYRSSDNVIDPSLAERSPQSVIDAVRDAGLQFDSSTGTGVVLHMLGCLAVDGRFGVTAIGRTPDHADALYVATVAAVVPRGVAAVELSR